MDDQMRAAANEVCEAWKNRPVGHAPTTLEIASEWLARDWLVEHDDEPLTHDWLREMRLNHPHHRTPCGMTFYCWPMSAGVWFAGLGSLAATTVATRGDVRRLTKALGIPLTG